MNKFCKALLTAAMALTMGAATVFAGCNNVYVTEVSQSKDENGNTVVTVTYSDGTTTVLDVNGKDGQDGKNGESLKIEDVFEAYKQATGEELTLGEFIERLNVNYMADLSSVVGDCLQSTLKVYSEFVEATSDSSVNWWGGTSVNRTSKLEVYTGSSVIYSIAADYTYLITNYHVIYDADAYYSANGNSYLARNVYCYLYGSEDAPVRVSNNLINYGDYSVKCEIVGGSISNDIAVLRARTSELKAINPDIKPVTFAEGYSVGETAIAIGNAEGEGISVTKGIVSIDNEFIYVEIDTERQYRTLRIDTAIYGGNSGGGLFNAKGELIGITNAGDGEDQNINFALPVQLVKPVVDNIMYYCSSTNSTKGKKIMLGVTVNSKNSRYVYDSVTGTGKIIEDVYINTVSGIAQSIGLLKNDIITAISVNGEKHELNRYFEISDILLTVREGYKISVSYKRGLASETVTSEYTVKADDLSEIE